MDDRTQQTGRGELCTVTRWSTWKRKTNHLEQLCQKGFTTESWKQQVFFLKFNVVSLSLHRPSTSIRLTPGIFSLQTSDFVLFLQCSCVNQIAKLSEVAIKIVVGHTSPLIFLHVQKLLLLLSSFQRFDSWILKKVSIHFWHASNAT